MCICIYTYMPIQKNIRSKTPWLPMRQPHFCVYQKFLCLEIVPNDTVETNVMTDKYTLSFHTNNYVLAR